jgi:transketolase
MTGSFDTIDTLCVNTIRTLSMDMVQKANSGHPGLPMGAAPMAYVLWTRHLKHNPTDPKWPNRDRFVLSAGHGSALLYSLLHLTGYNLTLEDIKNFRQWESKTPGHPESFMTEGVEATTGPLGQGSANAVGMAIAERWLANRYNRPGHEIVDHYTYALVSDGDLMEGISAEVSAIAGHLKLGKLIFLYDSNDISLDGPASMSFSTEDVLKRYEAYGWQTIRVEDGDTDLKAINKAIKKAKADTSRPTFIEVKTTIGYGSPNKQGTSASHGSPLGEEEVVLTKKNLGWDWPEETFVTPGDALAHFRKVKEHGQEMQTECLERFEAWKAEFPDLAEEWRLSMSGDLPKGWDADLPSWKPDEKPATRIAGSATMNAIAAKVPWLIGGDADLSVSTKIAVKEGGSFDGQTGEGRNIHCGVREHAMAAIANGIAYHGGCKPFTSTFFVFSDYMRPSIRLAAMNNLPVVFAFTHDSYNVGEDGPTHQPIEQINSLRLIPNLAVVRPSDAGEAVEAWKWAMQQKNRPVVLVMTRQGLPVIDRTELKSASELQYGAYVLSESHKWPPHALIIATGSEVHLALEAQKLLEDDNIPTRVVSMPCQEAFMDQDDGYREAVIPSWLQARVAVEAGSTMGWEKWVGSEGKIIGIDHFGASAPAEVLTEKFGFTAEHVADAIRVQL